MASSTETKWPRRNRFLCLHGPTQSAASFRAALKPICDKMARNFEFHFLEAPYIIPDEGDSESSVDEWTKAAIRKCQLTALEADAKHEPEESKAGTSNDRLIDQIRSELTSTREGKEISANAGYDDIEGLVSRKTGRSLSRNWITNGGGDEEESMVGVQLSLLQIGDYMRENGAFHGIIGYGTGGKLGILVQTLLSSPQSSAIQFPSFFPQLPRGVKRMPRIGGWEEEPPPPNDPRLGSENLANHYIPTQKPFELVVDLSPDTGLTRSLGKHADCWIKEKPPLLSTASKDGFHVHSISICTKEEATRIHIEKALVCEPGDDLLDPDRSKILADWIVLALASCQGDEGARKQVSNLSSSPPAKL